MLRLSLSHSLSLSLSLSLPTTHIALPRHFVLWGEGSDEKGGFICVEPWLGGPNSLNTRKGSVALGAGKEFRWAWSLQPTWAVGGDEAKEGGGGAAE